MLDLYVNIRKRREELGLSQEELAKKMGYKSRSSINKIEMGENDIPQAKIEAFAKALETTPAWLMGWDETGEKKEPAQSADQELNEYLEELRNSPTQKAMMSISKKASKEDVEAAYNIALAFLKGKGYLPDDE